MSVNALSFSNIEQQGTGSRVVSSSRVTSSRVRFSRRQSRWGWGARVTGGFVRFFAFSALHLANWAANVTIVVFMIRPWHAESEENRGLAVGVGVVLIVTHGLVCCYCVCIACSDIDIRRCSGNLFGLFGLLVFPLFLGLTQFIQFKIAWSKYTRRQPLEDGGDDDGIQVSQSNLFNEEAGPATMDSAGIERAGISSRSREAQREAVLDEIVPWTFPSKCFEGMFEGAVFAMVMMAVMNWWIPLTDFADLPKYIVQITCLLNFLTTGVSMLNFDYHLSEAVQKSVDHSLRYTFIHAVFRICETGSRITQIGVWLNIYVIGERQSGDYLIGCVGNYVLIADYLLCVLFLFIVSSQEERRHADLTTMCGKIIRILASLLLGMLMLIANISEFVAGGDRPALANAAFTLNRMMRIFRAIELICLIVSFAVFQEYSYACEIQQCIPGLMMTLVLGIITTVIYYVLLLAGFHHVAVRTASPLSFNLSPLSALALRVLDLPSPELSEGEFGEVSEATTGREVSEVTNISGIADNRATDADAADSARAKAVDDRAVVLLTGDSQASAASRGGASSRMQLHPSRMPIIAASNAELPESFRSPDMPDTFYHNQAPEYRVKRAPSLSFFLLSRGLHGAVADMVLPSVDEQSILPGASHGDIVVPTERTQMSDFEVLNTLGTGVYGTVVRCRKRTTGVTFAMKRLVKSEYVQRPAKERALPQSERDTLCVAGRHPYVAYLECAFDTEEFWILVTEFCDLGNLKKHIRLSGKPGLQSDEAARLGGNILQGLAHVHRHSMLHRDIKPENIGICGPANAPVAKLIDFGFAKVVSGVQTRTIVGSYGYCAPEIESARQKVGGLGQTGEFYDERIDLYSLGICIFVMLVGRETDDGGQIWIHSQFRALIKDPECKLWRCSRYRHKQIDGNTNLQMLSECGALETISSLTATQPSDRPRNARAAGRLPLFAGCAGSVPADWLTNEVGDSSAVSSLTSEGHKVCSMTSLEGHGSENRTPPSYENRPE